MEEKVTDSLAVLKLIHDMKSPLSALKILKSQAGIDPEHQRILTLACEYLEDLVSGVCPISDKKLRGHDIREAVRQVIVKKQYIYPTSLINLNVSVRGLLTPVPGTLIELKRVVANLLDNAIHATMASANQHPIDINVVIDHEMAVIECRDYALIESGRPVPQGWGLGLPIVYEICDLNRWKFWSFKPASGGTSAVILLRACDL